MDSLTFGAGGDDVRLPDTSVAGASGALPELIGLIFLTSAAGLALIRRPGKRMGPSAR
jgi:UPF0716 family protein affecting phage T7 exclusion